MRVDPVPVRRDAEIVDLAIRPVDPRKPPRPGAMALLAAAAIVVLLAAGLGVLGGRGPARSPDAAASSARSIGETATAARPDRSPRARPAYPCQPVPVLPPMLELVIDGQPFEGAITASPETGRITVPADAPALVHIAGDACANEWTIELASGIESSFAILDVVYNPELDPAYAAQNWLPLSLYEFQETSANLVATVRFPQLEARRAWPILVGSFEVPAAMLSAGGGAGVEMAGGCDVRLTLRNGSSHGRESGCDVGNIFAPEGPPSLSVRSGAALAFTLGTWDIESGDVLCGRIDVDAFVVDPACGLAPGGYLGTIEFQGPAVPGTWTLAAVVCAQEDRFVDPSNTLCGTWFANVEVSA